MGKEEPWTVCQIYEDIQGQAESREERKEGSISIRTRLNVYTELNMSLSVYTMTETLYFPDLIRIRQPLPCFFPSSF